MLPTMLRHLYRWYLELMYLCRDPHDVTGNQILAEEIERLR